jgi:hypothetical protein
VGAAMAHTFREAEYVCPVDGETFKAPTTMSYTVFGQRLDGRPYGALPVPPMRPFCPTSGFMMYKQSYSEAEIARAKALVASEEWRRWRASETPYFLGAMTAEHLGEPPRVLARLYQEAAWGAEGDAARHPRYLRAAIERLERFHGTLTPADDEIRIVISVRIAEMLRQAGDFAAASAAVDALPMDRITASDKLKELPPTIARLRQKIAERDRTPI